MESCWLEEIGAARWKGAGDETGREDQRGEESVCVQNFRGHQRGMAGVCGLSEMVVLDAWWLT